MITFHVARADNGVIGRDGAIPWHIPGEQRRFKAMTMGSVMIMGRKTFESLPGVLPGRRHIVLTRNRAWRADGAEIAHSVAEALALAAGAPVSVIGGAEIFAMFADQADAIALTEVHVAAEGDTLLAPFDSAIWREVSREDHETHSFIRLERAPSPDRMR